MRNDTKERTAFLCVHDHNHRTEAAMQRCEDGRSGAATGSRSMETAERDAWYAERNAEHRHDELCYGTLDHADELLCGFPIGG